MTVSIKEKPLKAQYPQKWDLFKSPDVQNTLKIFLNPSTSRKLIAISPSSVYGCTNAITFVVERPPVRRAFRFHNKAASGMPYHLFNPLFPYEYNIFTAYKNHNKWALFPQAPCFHSVESLRKTKDHILIDLLPNMGNVNHSMCVGTIYYTYTAKTMPKLVKDFYEFLSNTTYNSHILNLPHYMYNTAVLLGIALEAMEDKTNFPDLHKSFPHLCEYLAHFIRFVASENISSGIAEKFPGSLSPSLYGSAYAFSGNHYTDILKFISHPAFPGWKLNSQIEKTLNFSRSQMSGSVNSLFTSTKNIRSATFSDLTISATPLRTYEQVTNNFLRNIHI